MNKRERIDTSRSGASPLSQNPFGTLEAGAFPAGAPNANANAAASGASAADARPSTSLRKQPNRNRGRVDVIRQTAGRGGKTVTVITGFKGISERELNEIARTIQRACGVGGTLKSGQIEIQGDQRERVCEVLAEAGFQPVLAGG